jgi:hypothetical protein
MFPFQGPRDKAKLDLQTWFRLKYSRAFKLGIRRSFMLEKTQMIDGLRAPMFFARM